MATPAGDSGHQFTTVFGRGLVGELPLILPRPYLVVTMADLWPRFEATLAGGDLAGVHLVETLDLVELQRIVEGLPDCRSIVGLGGGQALDVAKFFAWSRGLPHLPGTDGDDGQRAVRSSVRASATGATCATWAGRSPRLSTSTST